MILQEYKLYLILDGVVFNILELFLKITYIDRSLLISNYWHFQTI